MKKSFILFLTFIFSLCSLSYQFIIVRVLDQFTLDEILGQSVTLGFYLLFMGLGAAFCYWKKSHNPGQRLFRIELILSLSGTLLVTVMYASYSFLSVYASDFFQAKGHSSWSSLKVILLFQVFSAFFGFLSGFEIPCLQSFFEADNETSAINKIVGVNYLGALAASFIVSIFLVPRLNLGRSVLLLGCLNLIGALGLLLLNCKNSKEKLLGGLQLMLVLACIGWSAGFFEQVEQAYLKIFYLEIQNDSFSLENFKTLVKFVKTLPPVERYVTPYQVIDITPNNWGYEPFIKNDFTFYLNMQPQFSESSISLYHQTMAHGGLNLAGFIPKNILILGAGDGLLAHEFLKYPEIESITLVELDPFMIELAERHEYLLRYNRQSLLDPRVHVVTGDAYAYLRQTQNKFQAVFVDFPFPNNYELGKLFSREFYQLLRSRLTPEGFAVLDAPINRFQNSDSPEVKPLPQDIVVSTLKSAGFKSLLFYGPVEPFVYVSMTSKDIQFDYQKLPSFIENRTLLNLTNLNHILTSTDISEANVNSIYKPLRFR